MKLLVHALLALLLATPAVFAQKGDKAGEVQKVLVPKQLIPPAPVLTPEQALKSFKLPPGFRIEVVAAEPLVEDPIALAFDSDGRIWAIEYRGYMPNVDGTGEHEPLCDVVVLEDTNGDGRADKRAVFLDKLVMPRAILLVGGGVIIAEPPRLWFCRDTDGDLKCDEKTELAKDYATGADPKNGSKAAHEHSSNGLLWAMDNWIYSANHTTRFRWSDGELQRTPTAFRGQWGLTQDDTGRLFYNSNSDHLRGDLIPSAYLWRNQYHLRPGGANVQIVADQSTWPSRVNPGINRGYQTAMLRDGRLAKFTAACGPVIYRGDQFPAEFYGNAFVCEPGGNFVRRVVLSQKGNTLTGANPYPKDEFLTSTDERFRPVNLYTAPDGTLYVADLYRGILQHHIYVTTYLRNQILERGLDKPLGLGRIYRIVHDGRKPGPQPQMSKEPPANWVKHLSHPNGWWRDTAQQLLVEKRPAAAIEPLRELAVSGTNPLGRLHALWTLDGLGLNTEATLTRAMDDRDPRVRAAAIRLVESQLSSNPTLLDRVLAKAGDSNPDVRLQLALSLGEATSAKADAAMFALLSQSTTNAYLRDAVISGLRGRELAMLETALNHAGWKDKASGRDTFLGALAACVFREGKEDKVGKLFQLTASHASAPWKQLAVLDGIGSTAPQAAKGKPAPKIRHLKLPAEPVALTGLTRAKDKGVAARAVRAVELVSWPGKPGMPVEAEVKPLTEAEKMRFEAGKELYSFSCGMCHQPDGRGQEGLAPPILNTDWSTGSVERLVRIVLHGMRGPLEIEGRSYNLEMPPLGVFDDEQLASILTYVRREWGHTASPVDAATVKRIRDATAARQDAWTEKELLQVK
jgi:mono/diheme cytochrome c family protein/glucose/arabinose dehydrogenase